MNFFKKAGRFFKGTWNRIANWFSAQAVKHPTATTMVLTTTTAVVTVPAVFQASLYLAAGLGMTLAGFICLYTVGVVGLLSLVYGLVEALKRAALRRQFNQVVGVGNN